MTEGSTAGERSKAFFEDLWSKGDHWELESSDFEHAKYSRQIGLLDERRYRRAVEIGCGGGIFIRILADISDHLLALDVAPSAIARSGKAVRGYANVELRTANIMQTDLNVEGPWNLVVLTETIYYLGWLYPFIDIAWFAYGLFTALEPGGRLLMANTQYGFEEPLMMPFIIQTYRDLFLNVGFHLEHEELFKGTKRGVRTDVLVSLFCKS